MRKILLATHNAGKVREFNAIFATRSLEIVSQAGYNIPAVEETGLSFVENAILKARNAARFSGLPALADDSGLEVDVLQGAPGVYSARYAGIHSSDEDNNSKLLTVLRGVAESSRTARFRCVLVLMRHAEDPSPLIAQGIWEGAILNELRGTHGFGYDPLFLVPELGCSAAELEPDVKNRLSHRAKALKVLLDMLGT